MVVNVPLVEGVHQGELCTPSSPSSSKPCCTTLYSSFLPKEIPISFLKRILHTFWKLHGVHEYASIACVTGCTYWKCVCWMRSVISGMPRYIFKSEARGIPKLEVISQLSVVGQCGKNQNFDFWRFTFYLFHCRISVGFPPLTLPGGPRLL